MEGFNFIRPMKKLLLILLLSLFFLPGLTNAQTTGLVPCGPEKGIPCQICHLFVLLENVIDFLLVPRSDLNNNIAIVPIVGVLMLVIGGIMFFAAAGNPNQLEKAKSIIRTVIIGFLIVYGSWIFVNSFLVGIGVSYWDDFGGRWFAINCPIVAVTNGNDNNDTPPTPGDNVVLHVESNLQDVSITSNTPNTGGLTDYTIEAGSPLDLQLTAPLTHNSHPFVSWTGCASSPATNTCHIKVGDNEEKTVTVNYADDVKIVQLNPTSQFDAESCDDICFAQGMTCNRIGTDDRALNRKFWGYSTGPQCSLTDGSCDTFLTLNPPGLICEGRQTQWTNCRCEGSIYVPPEKYELGVGILGAIGGVKSEPPGIDCLWNSPDFCVAEFDSGTIVRLTASKTDYFEGWSICPNVQGTKDEICELEMTASRAATARYNAVIRLRISGAGSGQVNVSNYLRKEEIGEYTDYIFNYAGQVNLIASPDDGSVFAGWEGNLPNLCNENEPECIGGIVTRLHEVTAVFEKIPAAPGKPDNVQCQTISDNQIDISWDEIPEADKYLIYRCKGDACDPSDIIYEGTTNFWSDDNLDSSTAYSYKIRGSNAEGPGDPSETVTCETHPPIPPAPVNVICEIKSPNAINVSWDEVDKAAGYKIYRCTGLICNPKEPVHDLTSPESSWLNSGLNSDTIYRYNITAYNISGESSHSQTVTCNTPPAVKLHLTIIGQNNVEAQIKDNLNNVCSYSYSVDGEEKTCAIEYSAGTEVKLTAEPVSGFAVWDGDRCSGVADNTCNFTINNDLSVDAIFFFK